MKGKNSRISIWKNLKRWLAGGLIAGGMLLPLTSEAHQDMILVENHVNNQGDGRYEELRMGHKSDATEGYGVWDTDYVFPAPWAGEWAPKIVTKVEGHELEIDRRPTNSVSKFEADLNVIIQNGTSISGTTKLGAQVYDTASTDYFDPKRHYPAEYKIYTNFTADGKGFVERKNLRDLCPLPNVTYEWAGPTNFVVNTTTNGEFNSGKFTGWCDWNQLFSTKTGNGTNSFEGNQIFDYGTSTNITLNAENGNYIDYYVLSRTDNTGCVSVVTNDIDGTSITFTNIPIDNIKGSNSIYAVYKQMPLTFTASSVYGTINPFGISTNESGTNLECKVLDSPVSLGEGTRVVANGGTVTGNAYTQNNPTNITLTLTNNANLVWNWKTQQLFNASSLGNSTITGTTNSYIDHGENAVVTNTPAEGYHFARWVGDVPAGMESNNPLTLAMTQPRTISASNDINTYLVTSSATGNGSVLPVQTTVAHGGTKIIQFRADPYHSISEAKENNEPIYEAQGLPTYDLVVNSITNNMNIEGKFEVNKSDGIPQTWLVDYDLTTNSGVGAMHSDDDKYNNLEEYHFGTNPTNKDSKLELKINRTGNDSAISWNPSITNTKYSLVSTDNLLNPNWTTNYSGYGTGQPQTYTNSAGESQIRFFRLKANREN